jgi:hypothetical protein
LAGQISEKALVLVGNGITKLHEDKDVVPERWVVAAKRRENLASMSWADPTGNSPKSGFLVPQAYDPPSNHSPSIGTCRSIR